MKHRDLGSRSFTTGDINLASCLMSVGVPLDPLRPASLTKREGNKDYASFHLMPQTVDGTRMTAELMELWGSPDRAAAGDPFAALMQFVRESPEGCRRSTDWLDHAHSWLTRRQERPIDAPRRLEGIEDFVSRHQTDLAGYIFSFPHNREVCWMIKERVAPSMYVQNGNRMSLVSTALPSRVAKELLARVKG